MRFAYYHVHVYCNLESRELCAQIRTELLQAVPQIAGAGPVRNRPVGPHPLPMFEAWFEGEFLDQVVEWLKTHRQGLTVLVHPLSGNELDDHTKYAQWMGEPLELDLSVLK